MGHTAARQNDPDQHDQINTQEAIQAINSHFRPPEAHNPWQALYKHGFRAVRVNVYPNCPLDQGSPVGKSVGKINKGP